MVLVSQEALSVEILDFLLILVGFLSLCKCFICFV